GTKHHRPDSKLTEKVALPELIERFLNQSLYRSAQQDEADVAVLGVRTRVPSQGQFQRLLQQLVSVAGSLEKFDIPGQAGGVRKQHANGHFCSSRIIASKARQQVQKSLLQVQLSTIIETHADRRGHDDLGQRRKIENRIRSDSR